MKKILFCASRVSHIINFHLPYIKYFKDKGCCVDIAVQGSTDNKLIDSCFDLKFTKNPFSPDNIKTVYELKKIIKNGNYDIICSNSTLAGAASRMAVMLAGKPKPYFVHISHGYMFGEKNGFKSKMYLLCEKATAKPVDSLIVMNKEDYSLAENYHLGKNIHYIHGMGVCPEKFPPITQSERAEIRRRLKIPDGNFALLCAGEFSERKNQMLIIQSFSRLLQNHKDIILIFAGDGQTLDNCRNTVSKLELDDRVRFPGQVSDINKIYRSCDILVSASKMEGLPFNVMEAMLCNLPIVASDIKGHSDLIKDGQNGLLFRSDSIEDMVQKTDLILSDKSLFTYIKSNARLEERYLIQNAAPQLLKILDKNYSTHTVPDSKKS